VTHFPRPTPFAWTKAAPALAMAMAIFHAAPSLAATPCAALVNLTMPDVAVTSATLVPAGAFVMPGTAAPAKDLPAFCRVVAVARPSSDSTINMEIWLPQGPAWNGKFQGLGNNGFNGAVSYAAMGEALRDGYAAASSDAGHVGGDLNFAQGHPEKVADWAHRSAHVTGETAKLVIRNHTGRWPAFSYFVGCDSGGHQALMEAQRYPDDYDGIIAGVPAANRVAEIIGYLGIWKATRDENGASLLPLDKLQLVTRSAVAMCDADDGVTDGVIDDPRRCKFDPASLICRGGDPAVCLSQAQADAVKRVYAGVKNPRTGELLFHGYPIGSEGFGNAGQSWNSLVNGPGPRRGEFFRYFVFHDPNWDWRTFDFDKDAAFALNGAGKVIDAIDPNMEAFRARGGKLITYAGWVDPILPGEDVIAIYDKVVATMGRRNADSFLRFYMVPGMGHCSGGPGATSFDMLPMLEQWVEKGVAPARVTASRVVNNTVQRTRPLCPYPQVARWTGKGSIDDAANFVCKIER